MEEEAISYDSLIEEATKLMKQRLPEYVVNCFISAGFDTLAVIADMDTSSEPGNSLQVIEEFISNEHPNDPKFTRGTMATGMFKFPPGHRHTITKFVKDVKQLQEGKRRQPSKRESDTSSTKAKRRRMTPNSSKASLNISDSSSSESIEFAAATQVSTLRDIRRQVTKWQQSQKHAKLRLLKEHQEYDVHVKAKGEGGNLIASIECKLCGKSYILGLKEGRSMISNWTKHIGKCALIPKHHTQVTGKLHQYFVTSPSVHASNSPSPSPSPDLFSPAGSEASEDHQVRLGELQLGGTDFSANLPEKSEMFCQSSLQGLQKDLPEVAQDQHFRLSPP